MPYQYDVQHFSITGDVLTSVFGDNAVDSIVFQLSEEEDQGGKTGSLIADIYAADSTGRRLRSVNVNWNNWRTVSLANEFTERSIYLTRIMVDEVKQGVEHGHHIRFKIESMEFMPKKFTYDEQEYPDDYKKDFMAYKVSIKRKKKD